MADYMCTIRSNYFGVKDEDQFRVFMKKVSGQEDEVKLWEKNCQKTGEKLFGFGCNSRILGIADTNLAESEPENYDHQAFLTGLQTCLIPGDAILIMEAGNEKFNYAFGACWVITSTKMRYLNTIDWGVETARRMLKDSEWTTQCDY